MQSEFNRLKAEIKRSKEGNHFLEPLALRAELFQWKKFCMIKSMFTGSQIMNAVKRVEARFCMPGIYREFGISTASFYKWQAKYGSMDVSMMFRMKELEEENRRLKKMYLEEKLKDKIKLRKSLIREKP